MSKPHIMGIVNITDNSFSQDTHFVEKDDINHEAAIEYALKLVELGADIIDIGGESTKPGAPRVDPDIELSRIIPTLTALIEKNIPVSVDTMHSTTAEEAIELGATYINDVSGGLADVQMADVIASYPEVKWIISHWMPLEPTNIMGSLLQGCVMLVDNALWSGVAPEQIILDPGLGFAKNEQQNWHIMSHLEKLSNLGFPIVIGASRKRFLTEFGISPLERDNATAALTAHCVHKKVWAVRVHNVPANKCVRDVTVKLCNQQDDEDSVRNQYG